MQKNVIFVYIISEICFINIIILVANWYYKYDIRNIIIKMLYNSD